MKFKQHLNKFIQKVNNSFKIIFNYDIKFRIDEMNLKTGMVVLYSYSLRSTLKANITEVISDKNILSHLSPIHASRLGYFYSKFELSNPKNLSLFARFERNNKCCVISYNRHGLIQYLDLQNNFINDYPENILDNGAIENFDSLQACYIGFLAGLRSRKKQTIKIKGKPSLSLVKNS